MLINVFASGTNIQRIAKNADGQQVDGILDVAYSQLEQTEKNFVRRKYYSLQYQGIHELLEAEFKQENMPNWNKIWAKPLKCKQFLSTLFTAMVGEDDMLAGLSLSAAADEDISSIMVFTSADNKPMNQAADLIGKILPKWKVVALNGKEGYSNRQAQENIRNEIKWAKEDGKEGIIIITNTMGSRSFSISEIQAPVFMYDRGSVDAAQQKSSRGATPGKLWNGKQKTTSHIFSFSFDSNRNEVIENIVLHEAVQVSRSENIEFSDAVKYVFRSVNIFNVDCDGDARLVEVDNLFKIYGENDNLLKVADITVKLDGIDDATLQILGDIRVGKGDKNQAKIKTLVPKAISKTKKNHTPREQKEEEKAAKQLEKLLNEAIRSINRSATTVYNLVMSGDSYRECLEEVLNNNVAYNEFFDFYGVSVENVISLIDKQVLNTPLLDVIVHNSKAQEKWI